MENIFNIIESNTFLIVLSSITILLAIGFILMMIKFSSINKKYRIFINKLGNGNNIEEDLENYMYRVERVEKQNAEILNYTKMIQQDLTKCIKKVGIVRYNAFKDTGSDLSFALALLDENNNGVVLNGIYSREMSNIYAKPVNNGESSYTISEEEREAIKKAMETEDVYKVK
ncbi:MAG: DUF4446 family protein [Clostridia bacterium]|nr:DUF4446 family protein [Clostridia bacterium]